MADEIDDFVAGSPSKFDWRRQSSGTVSSAQTDSADSSNQGAALQHCASMISTMAQLIQASSEYTDTVAVKTVEATEELKRDMVMLAESILRVEARLTSFEESNRNDTAATPIENSEGNNYALRDINDRVDAMAVSVDMLEKRLGGIESRVRHIEKLFVKCYRRRKAETAAKSA